MGTNCKYCGRQVQWRTSKAGKNYLAESAPISNEDGRIIKVIYPAHQCKATAEERAEANRIAAEQASAAIEAGQIVRGQTVTVIKGRKFPIGTTGVVTWVANEPDGYGVTKVRINTSDGQTIYININNIQASKQLANNN